MKSRRGETTFKFILRRQSQRTTATRFCQYPPLSLRNDAEQRRATEKYFCQTERACFVDLSAQRCTPKAELPAPHAPAAFPPRATNRQGSHAVSRAPLPRAAGQARPIGAAAPPPRGLYVRLVIRTYKLQTKTRKGYWELVFKGIES